MRTTVNISDDLLIAAKRRARERGASLGAVIDDALRRALFVGDAPSAVPLPLHRGHGGLRPGVNPNSNRELHELLDEGIPREGLR